MTPTAPDLPDLPSGWTARVPGPDDLPALARLRVAGQAPFTGDSSVDEAGVESEVMGQASWTRRQIVAAGDDGVPRAWLSVQDRAAGRSIVSCYVDRTLPAAAAVAGALYAWAERVALGMARLRGIEETRLDASPFSDDDAQLAWLVEAGYSRRRRWLHLTRPVRVDEVVPPVREGVTVRRVETHPNGIPIAEDLQIVHRMLEESFEDHFNSYRESFPEFVQRLREDPGHRWDHWWLVFVDTDEGPGPAGALVSSVLGADETGHTGSYVEYIGVNRHARGRGVAKGLLFTVIADAVERGRNRVDLEVDDTSPTNADQLYVSLGWHAHYVTDSWFRDLTVS
ncbi:MAG: GNAT family N-acetyltransferase [Nocardioides sp.]